MVNVMNNMMKKEEEASSVLDIKFAKPEDISQIVAFGYKSFDENLLKGLGMEPTFEKAITSVTDFAVNHAILVKRNEDNDKFLDGVCVIQTTETWWSDTPLLYVVLYYIKPEKRSFKLARDLLKAAQEYAIMSKLPLVIDLFGQKDITRKQKLLRYLGFKELGSTFLYNPTNKD